VLLIAENVFRQNIATWLAGLGIAGIAVSLAAQDSLKNLFGSITILLDRPFKLGDRIVFSGYDGPVEEIGFRSIKIRTLTGHLVTVPNSKVVNEAVENIGARPYIRRLMNVTITYDTPREKVELAVKIIQDLLEEEGLRKPVHGSIGSDEYPPKVYFSGYNADSLNILVLYWFFPPKYWDYMNHAQRFNLRLFEEYEKAGIEFAFPTQTLFLAGDPNRGLSIDVRRSDGEDPRLSS
jgi:MscS family membrane protein